MCGIAGVVGRGERVSASPSSLAERLGGALAHRGPDDCGVWRSPDDDVLLVHRRLAIIDPGPSGAQPMVTPDGRHRLVFNGEVYNYRELRSDLESRGERFVTMSDTEVLLRLMAREGPAALTRVRGMFALACWDDRERVVLLARDRFGIKPLYVAASPSRLAFASELGALRKARLVDSTPAPEGVLGFLTWGSVPPPLTWLRDARMLAPGSWLEWRQNGSERRGTFADSREPYRSDRRRPFSDRELGDAIGAAVRDSVRAHLVADVPVGVFLSGGLDSGALVSAATSAGATRLQTFTVGFDDTTSEAGQAALVAATFGTEHHELRVQASHVADDFGAILARLDQPTIDAVNSYYVARAVAASGIKAVLSGTGGDELFGGYPSFRRLPRALALKRAAGGLWPLAVPFGTFLPRRLRPRWHHFASTNGRMAEAYRAQRGFLLPTELDELAGPALRDTTVWRGAHETLEGVERQLLDAAGPESMPASVARLETRMYLGSQLLRDIDAMAMAHGLEVRVPFVDHLLIETVWPELGFHPPLLAGKRVLPATLDRPLPAAIVAQPKQTFTLPFARWMRGELAPMVRDGLNHLASAGWIGPNAPERVWQSWQSGGAHWSRPWGLAVLGHFLSGGAQ